MIDMIEGEGLAERYDDVRYAYDYLLEQIEEEADSEEEFLAQRALRTDEEIEEDAAAAAETAAFFADMRSLFPKRTVETV